MLQDIAHLARQCREVVQAGTEEGVDFPQWPLEMYEAELKKERLYCVLFFDLPDAGRQVVKVWESALLDGNQTIDVSANAQLEAFVFFHRCDEGVYEVGFLGSRHKGAGVGQQLMRELLGFIDSKEMAEQKQLLLEVRTDNARAACFYDKHGFEQIGFRKNYYPDGCDARVLRKTWNR